MPQHITQLRRLAAVTLALALAIPVGSVLASHSFSDVPTSHKFHADIAAIAAAGITTGCAADRYCPDGLVTRGQMAAFLNRLGALGPGKAPKVNADRLDGIHGSGFARGARATVDRSAPNNTRVLLDARTGAELVLTSGNAHLRIVNTSSQTMRVDGTWTHDSFISPGSITLAPMGIAISPGAAIDIGAGAIGPSSIDVMIVISGPTGAKFSHLTCSGGIYAAAISCIVTG